MSKKISKLKNLILLKKFHVGVSFLAGLISGYILGFFRTYTLFSLQKISIDFSWLNNLISSPLLKGHSSYNLGMAITAMAIIVAFIEFISNGRELKFRLNYKKLKIAL